MVDDLRALKGSADKNRDMYKFDGPHTELLERVAAPEQQEQTQQAVELVCAGFTSLCPVTGQPDHGKIEIEYHPGKWLVESKSLKLYLMSFRTAGVFGEHIVARIGKDLRELLDPEWLDVVGEFASRGDVQITARSHYLAPEDFDV